MPSHHPSTSSLSLAERQKRKRYLSATLVTCLALAMIFGVSHVVKLGANRMADMRNKATYALKDEAIHIRAAGEDILLHQINESGNTVVQKITQVDVDTMLPPQTWQEIEPMLPIPAGEFTMGTDMSQADPQNKPAHQVFLPSYQIDKYPVTIAQYARFMVATNYRPPLDWKNGVAPPGRELQPVTMVSWYDAKAYCEWAGKRLPSEAEWEKAARGSDGRRWPWGNKMDNTRLNTYYNVGAATAVTTYSQGVSPYGVYDMAGNVSEWVADDFGPYAGSNAPLDIFAVKKAVAKTAADRAMKVVDLEITDARYKVRRGGSWKSDPFSTASFHRNFSMPYYASDFFGFRCAKEINQEEKHL